jgi:hypothetical protein
MWMGDHSGAEVSVHRRLGPDQGVIGSPGVDISAKLLISVEESGYRILDDVDLLGAAWNRTHQS